MGVGRLIAGLFRVGFLKVTGWLRQSSVGPQIASTRHVAVAMMNATSRQFIFHSHTGSFQRVPTMTNIGAYSVAYVADFVRRQMAFAARSQ